MGGQKLGFLYSILFLNVEKKKGKNQFSSSIRRKNEDVLSPWLCFFAHSEHSADWGPSEVLRWPLCSLSASFTGFLKQNQTRKNKISTKTIPGFFETSELQKSTHKPEPHGFLSKCRCHQLLVFHLTTIFDHWFLVIFIQPESSKHVFNYRQQPAAYKTGLILLSKPIALKQSRPEII